MLNKKREWRVSVQIHEGLGLVLDIETTGLSPINDEVIEIALKLFSFDQQTGDILTIKDERSYLREPETTSALRNYNQAYKVHGIPFEEVVGKSFDDREIKKMFAYADIVLAHNASFDRSFLYQMYPNDVNELKWYCTMRGVPWKEYGFYNSKLLTLLKGHQITNYQNHRAMDDITYLLALLKNKNPNGESYLKDILRKGPMRKYQPKVKKYI